MRGETAPIVAVGAQRRKQEREVVGNHALFPLCRNDTGNPRSEGCLVFTRAAKNHDLALLDGSERRENARAVALVPETESVMHEPEVVEVVAPVLLVVLQ
jgi:hypothetical protein